ncbi:cupin domain-containing protein [Anaerosporobacter faecicola]|uniref:cupin domain-containing protein n=1 Tax=Anaerosporobacter faecicola TaxID=2718714 RepID=UPI002368203A|nr:cupin domain-containing protein [Anaerosporobacter faecicola]
MDRHFEERMQEKLDELKKAGQAEPIRSDGAGSLDLGPRNLERDEQNPDILVPPATDFGLMPNLRFSFADAHMILKPGGWSREITKRELPIDDTLAIVDMNLSPGVREMHTHQQSEWGYVLQGGARVTAVDERGRNFVADCKPGEGWIFPANIPHSIQGLQEGCEFLMLFDKGSYSENNTFSISEMFSHFPMDVLSANFGVDEEEFEVIPKKEVYIVDGGDPGPLKSQEVPSPYGKMPLSLKHELINVKPIVSEGGSVRILDHENFPACTTIAAALVEIEPGAMREIHWHSNNDELQYYIQGEARMTVFQPGPKARTYNYRAGDVGYVPVGNFHYVQNIGKEKVVFLEIFNSKHFADISLAQWIAMTPKEVVKSVLNLSDEFLKNVKKERCPVVKYEGYEMPSPKNTPQNVRYFKNFDYKVKKPCNAAKEH